MNDEFVIRKHVQILADAGVDTLILYATNAFTYDNIWSKIDNIYMDMRSKLIRTPKFCFITWSYSKQTVRKLYENLYSQNLYRDLWYFWNDKPLIFANPYGFPSYLLNVFTIHESWAWTKDQECYGNGRNKWPWIDNYPQGRGLNEDGQFEQTCVSVAGHPLMNIGCSYDGPIQHEPEQINPMIGTYFFQQWEQALKIESLFIFVTGTIFFVDEFIQEYSRDIEPMLDDLCDIPSRNHPQYGNQGGQLIDYSQRNDLERMQIAENKLNWLFLNIASNYTTGWIGFDYLVDLGENQLKKNLNNTSHWQYQETITIINSGYNELHFALSYQSLHINKTRINLQFKWLSANCLYTFDSLNFIDKGDSAPNGKFTYTYMI
ncbi:unnamed protein product [Rotaria sp. Silwood1]|nr:unnamed protein product [Rotaria sp. Silwood1]CAF1296635.1 unnamed protein product [Rotaria sp. Silwood1]CAF3546577.1 unnamed protein product [Rotaria sp. Silwood1]CAF4783606.1 unnamed protein product [Rotaria sp. Silwood1]